MCEGVKRVFLGWEGSVLDRAAEWILRERGEDLGRVLVALPGSRAARALRERLARRAKPSWSPPEILTQGALIDALVETDRPVAGRLARTLAWARALGDLPRERLELLAARPPEKDDLRGRLALAETVRALHADLAEEGIGFDRLADEPRFAVLAEAQRRWRAILDGLGLADPHESRFAAIDAGKLVRDREVILVGVADMNGLLRHLLAKLGGRATALVVAPESDADAFDDFGCARAASWKERDLAIPLERWRVVDGPDAQAEAAVSILAALDGRFAPEDVSIGLCDEEVGPYLERRLGEERVVARHAAGTPIEMTRPFRLLAHASAWLARRAFAAYAELLRHPDLEATLLQAGALDLPGALDDYHALHLPQSADGAWLAERSTALRAADGRLRGLLAGLDGPVGTERPLAEWPAAVRGFLANVYDRDLDAANEQDRVLAASLALLSDALEEIEQLPRALGVSSVAAADAIDLLLATAGGGSVAPPPPASGAVELEMLGWLELPLDGARALVVTGFQDGRVPSARRDDPFLPDGARRDLVLPCADDRVARDVYAATALLASGRDVFFVCARRNGQGDPLLPSRLLFHVPKEDLLPRVERALGRAPGSERGSVPAIVAREPSYALPRRTELPPVESMSVTSFADYLRSPYGFYLKHVLRADRVDDAAREMDGRSFGTLAHDVFKAFGASDARDSTDASEIARFARSALEEIALARFGRRPLPAVGLQVRQLARRLDVFAREQAKRAAQGWRIVAVEWAPSAPVALDLGGGERPMLLRGKIDRIEARETRGGAREWAILDYKTSKPDAARARSGEWRDLQLPLYTLLAREIVGDEPPALGIFTVGKETANTGVEIAGWDAAAIDDALDAARRIALDVRRGELFDLGDSFLDDPILLAIAGKGLVASVAAEGDESSAPAAEAAT
jgi:RecB family exonuclease